MSFFFLNIILSLNCLLIPPAVRSSPISSARRSLAGSAESQCGRQGLPQTITKQVWIIFANQAPLDTSAVSVETTHSGDKHMETRLSSSSQHTQQWTPVTNLKLTGRLLFFSFTFFFSQQHISMWRNFYTCVQRMRKLAVRLLQRTVWLQRKDSWDGWKKTGVGWKSLPTMRSFYVLTIIFRLAVRDVNLEMFCCFYTKPEQRYAKYISLVTLF